MPPTQEMIANAARVLAGVRLESFTVTPERIRPFEQSKSSWQIASPPSGSLALKLNWPGGTASIPARGSRSVSPTATTTYRLTAISPPLSKVLGSGTVQVVRAPV